MVKLSQVGYDGELVRLLGLEHVFGLEERGDAELLLGNFVGEVVVAEDVVGIEAVGIGDQVGPEMVDDPDESEAIPERGCEVRDVDAAVVLSDAGAPNLQGSHAFSLDRHFYFFLG